MAIAQKVVVFTGSTMILGCAKQVIHDFREILAGLLGLCLHERGVG